MSGLTKWFSKPEPIQGFCSLQGALGSSFLEARRRRRVDYHDLMTTGLLALDELAAPLAPGELIVVAGAPRMAKTAFALHIAIRQTDPYALRLRKQARAVPATLLFSTQCPQYEIVARLLCAKCRLSRHQLLRGWTGRDEWRRVRSAGKRLAHANLHLHCAGNLSLETICAEVARAQAAQPVRMVIVDALQQLSDAKEAIAPTQTLATMKRLAVENNVAIVGVLDLPRRGDRPCSLDDLGDWHSLEWIMDKTLFLHRPVTDDQFASEPLRLQIDVATNRSGDTGTVYVHYLAPSGQLLDAGPNQSAPVADRDWHVETRWMLPEPGKGLGALVLQSAEELKRETNTMHNCASSHAADCGAGSSRIISIRESEDGEPQADALLKFGVGGDPQWGVAEIVDRKHRGITKGETFDLVHRIAKEWSRRRWDSAGIDSQIVSSDK